MHATERRVPPEDERDQTVGIGSGPVSSTRGPAHARGLQGNPSAPRVAPAEGRGSSSEVLEKKKGERPWTVGARRKFSASAIRGVSLTFER